MADRADLEVEHLEDTLPSSGNDVNSIVVSSRSMTRRQSGRPSLDSSASSSQSATENDLSERPRQVSGFWSAPDVEEDLADACIDRLYMNNGINSLFCKEKVIGDWWPNCHAAVLFGVSKSSILVRQSETRIP